MNKDRNLNIRVSSDEFALFRRAADVSHQTLSQFVREAALKRAAVVLQHQYDHEGDAGEMSDLASDNKWSFTG